MMKSRSDKPYAIYIETDKGFELHGKYGTEKEAVAKSKQLAKAKRSHETYGPHGRIIG